MRLMIVRMLTSTSIAAFSTSVSPTGETNTRPIRPVRSSTTVPANTAPTSQVPVQAAPGSGNDAGAPASRILPRGSLLDLAV